MLAGRQLRLYPSKYGKLKKYLQLSPELLEIELGDKEQEENYLILQKYLQWLSESKYNMSNLTPKLDWPIFTLFTFINYFPLLNGSILSLIYNFKAGTDELV